MIKKIGLGVTSIEASIENLKWLSVMVGKQRVAWRSALVLLTDKYTMEQH